MGVRQFSLLAVIAATILACGKCQMGLNDTLCQLLGPQVSGGLDDMTGFVIGATSNMYAADQISVFIAGNPAETVILQVRRTDQNCPVGTFSLTTIPETDGLTLFSCGTEDNTAVSTQAMSLPRPLQVRWTPPTYNAGTLEIYGRFTDGSNVFNQAGFNTITPEDTIGPVQTIGMTACPPDGTSSTFTPPNCMRGDTVIGPAVCTPDSNLQTGDTVECTCMECNTVTCSFTVAEDTMLTTDICPPVINNFGNTYFWTPPNCLRNGVLVGVSSCTPIPGSTFTAFNSPVTCTCNVGGDTATCDFTIDAGPPPAVCNGNPCLTPGAECREAVSSVAGYTCHITTGTPCPTI